MCELDENATVTSIDEVSAYDTISRRAMLLGLETISWRRSRITICATVLFRTVREDDDGVVQTIRQGEGGEQGDPLVPLLFCVGQHSALEAIQRRLRQSERLLACLDDVCLVSQLDRARDAHNVAEQVLWTHAKIRIHAGSHAGGVR